MEKPKVLERDNERLYTHLNNALNSFNEAKKETEKTNDMLRKNGFLKQADFKEYRKNTVTNIIKISALAIGLLSVAFGIVWANTLDNSDELDMREGRIVTNETNIANISSRLDKIETKTDRISVIETKVDALITNFGIK